MSPCTTDKCPQILDSSCVFYEGSNLIFSGINTNDSVEVVIQKLNLKLESIPTFNSNNYYNKSETYSKVEVDNVIDNIPRVVNLTLTDLGMTPSNTEEEINQALADYINGLNLTVGEKELYFFQVNGFSDGSSSSADQLIEVTYDELVNLKNTSSLVKGQNYLLTDYMTTYTQPTTEVDKSSGIIEPLYITAVDVDKLHNKCFSVLYPQDIVYYEITGDIGDGNGTEGFTKGKIYRRIDTQKNNDIGTDWRHIKYDRDGVDKLLFEDYEGCYNNVIKTYYLFDNIVGNNFHSNTINDGFFNNTIGNYCANNIIGSSFFNNIINDNFQSNTIRDNSYDNTIDNDFRFNIIGYDFYTNTIGNYFQSNKISNNFRTNTIGSNFKYNTIGDDFYSNNIGDKTLRNTITGYFISNTIDNNFTDNTIAISFTNNTINNYFQKNIIGASFYGNIIGINFTENKTNADFQNNGDISTPFLSLSTEFRCSIYGGITSTSEIQNPNIDVVVFKSPNGTLKQRYYDDSNNLVINNL